MATVTGWTEERIWDAVEAWRWIPPGSTREDHENFELAVTPGSYALSFAYGFRAPDGPSAESALTELQRRVQAAGGTGVRIHVDPRSRPADLPDRLRRRGYRTAEDAEVLVWELRDGRGDPRLPPLRAAEGVEVREVRTKSEFHEFVRLSRPIFGDPVPPEATIAAFTGEFERAMRETGRSDRFLAWKGPVPVGRAGMEVVGEVARLWGTGVLPEHRRGGVYSLLVRARCEEALRRGATLALATGLVGTSAPILKRRGFRAVGVIHRFEAHWT